ncbi:MAG: hypothetical protein KJ047_02585 [Anaerolineae bacterium]|nr:hypothetical protein [Anaerolineae bacterium]
MSSSSYVTDTVSAAHSLTIEIGPEIWRLVNGAFPPSQRTGMSPMLVEAHPDGLAYAPEFARARHLPPGGWLAPSGVVRVVVGWAPELQSWHLGLLLDGPAEAAGELRWCGLASWPQGAAAQHEADARHAAQALARLLDRPLHVVAPPRPAPIPAPAPAARSLPVAAPAVSPMPAPAEASLREPPLTFDAWAFVARRANWVWKRRAHWVWGGLLRAVGLVVLAVVFVWLGAGTLDSGLAAVDPSWLPALGLAVAVALLAAALRALWSAITTTDVVLDVKKREVRVRSRFTGSTRWRLPFDRVSYVLLTQTAPRPQGRKGKDGPMRVAQDVWVHLAEGDRFWQVVELGRVEGTSRQWDAARVALKQPGRRRIRLADLDSPAQHAVLHMARVLETDVWLDVRK